MGGARGWGLASDLYWLVLYHIAGYFQGLYISRICKFEDVIFTSFCCGHTFEVFQGFIFHGFGLYHEILEIKIP